MGTSAPNRLTVICSAVCSLLGAYLLTCLPATSSLGPSASERPGVVPAPASTADAGPAVAGDAGPARAQRATARYAVVAESTAAAEAALAVLDRGGSAADAAVTGVLAAGVVQPVSSGLGGGGFALYWDAEAGRAWVLDFREVAPRKLRAADLGPPPVIPRRRGVQVGVPGELAGLCELHDRWGTLPLAELVRPAAELAAEGFAVSHHMSRALRWNRSWVLGSPAYSTIFAPLGELLASEAVARNPALASTLDRIATEGRRGFYEGRIADDIVATAAAAGSPMTTADLRAYRVERRAPLQVRFAGHDVYTTPPPSGGGLLLAETLAMHDPAELARLGHGTGAYLHLLAETFRGAMADRIRAVGDPAFVDHDLKMLLSRQRLETRRRAMSLHRTKPIEAFELRDAGTSHFAAVDARGNAVAITTSIHQMFGAKLCTASGFPLNDQLAAFSSPKLEQRFGAGMRPNAPRPSARPVSDMAPTLVVRDHQVVLAVGGSGGTRIGTAVTQALLGRLLFRRTAAQAVSDLRVHTPASGGLWVEPAAQDGLVADLRRRGEQVRRRPDYGAVGMIAAAVVDGEQELQAAADPRKGGVGIVQRRAAPPEPPDPPPSDRVGSR